MCRSYVFLNTVEAAARIDQPEYASNLQQLVGQPSSSWQKWATTSATGPTPQQHFTS